MIKANNFDFLRFVFALLVVVSHSYVLSGNAIQSQWIYQLTSGQIEFSNIGLNGFFVLSGYLIFKSLERSKSLAEYYWKRLLRLFPALFVVLLVTVLAAPLVYENAVPYLKNHSVLTYLPNNLSLYHLQFGIKGVFEDNPYPSAINGSLWTICYEFSMYVLLSVLFFVRRNTKTMAVLISAAFLVLFICHNFFIGQLGAHRLLSMQGNHFINLGAFFVGGSVLASWHLEKLRHKRMVLMGFIIIMILAFSLHFYSEIKHIIFPVIVLLTGLCPMPFFSSFGKKFGDMSYGIYIYGFPIQQTLMHFFGMDTMTLMLTSVILSMIFGYISWHLIEKNILKYKKIPFFERQIIKPI
ncbi:MAG TPA: acyltransferase [Flavobacterium sp.]|nr:acyltransferase [Flavobacterium sp.]